MSRNIDEKCLIVRNFPASFSATDIREFLQMFDANHLDVYQTQHTALAEFRNKDHAHTILTLLHQVALDENRLFVEYAPKNHTTIAFREKYIKSHAVPNCAEACAGPTIDEALKRLFATADGVNLNQPPPPYLRYEYPKANREIIDAIGIALECVPKFYTQVLHLMNRMNLEPPFIAGDKRLVYESSSTVEYATSSTQTDEIIWHNRMRNKRKCIESDESELESTTSSDDAKPSDEKRKKLLAIDAGKQEMSRKRQRNLLKMQRLQKQLDSIANSESVVKINEAFDLEPNVTKGSTIKIVMPEQLDATRTTDVSVEQINTQLCDKTDEERADIWSDAQLDENRIPSDQLHGHPMFQNYHAGELSNRLYIKNIAKEVSEDDLRAIYHRYLESNCDGQGNIRSVDIRLMTSGRMKGQAFITFDGPYLNCDIDNEAATNLPMKYQMITKAIHETNGLILKGKPLVVVYGKTK